VDNYAFVPDWLFGVARFEPVGNLDRGLGAIFETSIPIGLWTWNFETEVTEYRRDAVIALTSRHRKSGTFSLTFDQLGRSRSIVTMEVDYERAPGVTGYLTDKFVATFGDSAIKHTEARLRKRIELHHGINSVGRIA
jgi:hypothetical protein